MRAIHAGLTFEDLRRKGMPKQVIEAVDCLTRRGGELYDDFIERVKTNPRWTSSFFINFSSCYHTTSIEQAYSQPCQAPQGASDISRTPVSGLVAHKCLFKILNLKEQSMPLVNVKCIEGVFSDLQKTQLVEKLTDAMVSIEGENLRPVTWVVIEEVKSGDWGIGGKPLSTEAVKALASGKSIG
jgi:4-oxalocrotonate tautomerase